MANNDRNTGNTMGNQGSRQEGQGKDLGNKSVQGQGKQQDDRNMSGQSKDRSQSGSSSPSRDDHSNR